jgi:hypothetical protein
MEALHFREGNDHPHRPSAPAVHTDTREVVERSPSEVILLLLGSHNPFIIILMDLDILLQIFNGLYHIHVFIPSFSMSVGVCSFNGRMDIHPSDLVFLVISPLCLFHYSRLYVDSDLV